MSIVNQFTLSPRQVSFIPQTSIIFAWAYYINLTQTEFSSHIASVPLKKIPIQQTRFGDQKDVYNETIFEIWNWSVRAQFLNLLNPQVFY